MRQADITIKRRNYNYEPNGDRVDETAILFMLVLVALIFAYLGELHWFTAHSI
jgi:hypothetical protein